MFSFTVPFFAIIQCCQSLDWNITISPRAEDACKSARVCGSHHSRLPSVYVGIVLIIIALILGGVQDLHFYNIYGGGASKWYFYSSIGIILLIGIALVAWSYMRQRPQKERPPEIRSTTFLVPDEENVVRAPKR